MLEDSSDVIRDANACGVPVSNILRFEDITQSKFNSLHHPLVFISVASTPARRHACCMKFKSLEGSQFPFLKHESCIISSSAKISEGVFLDKYTTVESLSKINAFAYVNSHSHIGHNSTVGVGSILGGSVTINGRCEIGDYSLIGSGVIVKNGVKIGNNCIIQAGSVVLSDIKDDVYATGNPATPVCSSRLLSRY